MEKYFDVNFPGYSVKCKLYCRDVSGIRKLVIFGHGFGGHKDNKAAERFAKSAMSKNRGAAVLTFDWPCHGADVRKTLTLSDCDVYLDAVLKEARERFHPEALYGYATSFGGYLFLNYIASHGDPFEKLALRCPAVRMYDVISRIVAPEDMEKLDRGKTVEAGFDRKIKIDRQFTEELRQADITAVDFMPWADRMMILHGTKDEIVPLEMSYAFAEKNVIEFLPVENADHRFIDPGLMDKAISEILKFFGS